MARRLFSCFVCALLFCLTSFQALAAVVGAGGDVIVAKARVVGELIVDAPIGFQGTSAVRGTGIAEWAQAALGISSQPLVISLGTNCTDDCSFTFPGLTEFDYFGILDIVADTDVWREGGSWNLDGDVYLFLNGGDVATAEWSGMTRGSGLIGFVGVVPVPASLLLIVLPLAALRALDSRRLIRLKGRTRRSLVLIS